MIKKAREKGINAKLIVGDAAGMPLEDRAVNYIKNRFAFHHYVEKEKAVGEMYRVLKPHGILSMLNLNHEYMNYSWVYKYFPASVELDKDRFPKAIELYKWLESIGFKVSISVKVDVKKFKYRDIIAETKNKDMSQLQIITEDEYRRGLEKMEEDGRTHECIMGDIALTEVCAKK
jgi:ubiquinone/menaquinone biosynthesis C-methylase UbiE